MATTAPDIDASAAHAFLAEHFDPRVAAVELIGEGAWSLAFGFLRGQQQLVARFGRHVDDFEKDQLAFVHHAPALPVPEVLAIGTAFEGHYAISTRVHGSVLENLPPAEWRAAVPSLVAALDALRLADVTATSGYGEWDGAGSAPYPRWSAYLLAVADDTPDRRTHGWRQRLDSHAVGAEAFAWGYELLRNTARDDVSRSLVHADLMNRNVLVEDAQISGVFDWGCAAYGDHLYDLAWFEFWAPWHPNLAVPLLRASLEHRWRETHYHPANLATRLTACYLHIGLAHLAYNAYLADWTALTATVHRMRQLALSPQS